MGRTVSFVFQLGFSIVFFHLWELFDAGAKGGKSRVLVASLAFGELVGVFAELKEDEVYEADFVASQELLVAKIINEVLYILKALASRHSFILGAKAELHGVDKAVVGQCLQHVDRGALLWRGSEEFGAPLAADVLLDSQNFRNLEVTINKVRQVHKMEAILLSSFLVLTPDLLLIECVGLLDVVDSRVVEHVACRVSTCTSTNGPKAEDHWLS